MQLFALTVKRKRWEPWAFASPSLALIALVAYVVGGSIVNSLGGLADAANAIARGRLDRRVNVRGRDEFARLGLAFNEMADQLEARDQELGAERARLREATVRFGEALAATHDVDQLLRVIIETVVETTGLAMPSASKIFMRVPLPGGRRIFSDDLQDPLASLNPRVSEGSSAASFSPQITSVGTLTDCEVILLAYSSGTPPPATCSPGRTS